MVKHDINNGVATLSLCRSEKHNAFNADIIQALLAQLEALASRNDVRVLVLAAEGKHFCAGADLAWMKNMAQASERENQRDAQQLALLMHTLNTFPTPVIARVQGAAYGGAIGLIACSDIVVASTSSRFCLSEVKLGLAPATIAPYVIAALGARQCRRFMLSAEVFDARLAHAMGLIHHLVAESQLDQTIADMCQQLCNNGPRALRATKQLIHDLADVTGSSESHESLMLKTSQLIAQLRVSDEGQEGLHAFLDKRKPAWQPDSDN